MNKSIKHSLAAFAHISTALMLCAFLSISSMSLFAKGPVKPLCQKALKKIEVEYGKETRALFSGKESYKNVLALKRLIAEEIDPDLAIAAIKKYQEAAKLRSGSIQKRQALSNVAQLFSGSNLSSKDGRNIIIEAGTSISARKSKTMSRTYNDSNKPRCRSKKTVKERAPKIKHEDPDQLAEQVILSELDGKTPKSLLAAL